MFYNHWPVRDRSRRILSWPSSEGVRNVIVHENFIPRCFNVGKNAIDKGIWECGLIETKKFFLSKIGKIKLTAYS